QRSVEIRRRNGCRQGKTRHLSQRMDSGIRPPAPLRQYAFAGNALNGIRQRTLNGYPVRLNLPAMEVCAVISQHQLPPRYTPVTTFVNFLNHLERPIARIKHLVPDIAL